MLNCRIFLKPLRKLPTIFIIITLFQTAYSQDLIVSNEGDSLKCKVTKIDTDYMYFTYTHEGKLGNVRLPLTRLMYYQINYYKSNQIEKNQTSGNKKCHHIDWNVNSGYSYLTAKIGGNITDEFMDYLRDLKSGFNFGGDFNYYFSDQYGLGIKYSNFSTSSSMNSENFRNNDGSFSQVFVEDKINMSFIGPSFSFRLLSHDKKKAFVFNFSLAYMGYRNYKTIIEKYKITGNALGSDFNIGYEMNLTKKTSAVFKISLISGKMYKYYIDDGINKTLIFLDNNEFSLDDNGYESLQRVDFTIGLRFGK